MNRFTVGAPWALVEARMDSVPASAGLITSVPARLARKERPMREARTHTIWVGQIEGERRGCVRDDVDALGLELVVLGEVGREMVGVAGGLWF